MNPFDLHFSRRQLLLYFGICTTTGVLDAYADTPVQPSADDEESAYQLAKQAYLYGYPLVYFARFRQVRLSRVDAERATPYRWNALGHVNAPVGPTNVGAPQTDTFYSRLFHDVTTEPVLIKVPATDGRYWSLQMCDYLGTTFGMPSRRSTPGPTVLAIVGPNWKGSLPAEVSQVFHAPMNMGFTIQRTYYAGAADMAKAAAQQTAFDARPLSAYLANSPWDGVDGSQVYKPATPAEDPLADFKAMQHIWQQSPPPRSEQSVWGHFAPLGLAVGARPVDSLPMHVKKGMARAEAEVRALIVQTTRAVPGMRTANGWVLPKPSIGLFQDKDYLYRATVALFGTIATPVSENVYVVAQHEPGFKERLNGARRYELHFSKANLPQADAFWSVHAYTDRYTLIPNPAAHYAVGDRTPGLAYNADGSLTVYLQYDSPGTANEANWLATQQDQPFSLVIRAYEPKGQIRDLTWQGPEIRVVG